MIVEAVCPCVRGCEGHFLIMHLMLLPPSQLLDCYQPWPGWGLDKLLMEESRDTAHLDNSNSRLKDIDDQVEGKGLNLAKDIYSFSRAH